MIKNLFMHLHTVNKHRWYVFKLSIRAGIPFRGLIHDLSKYSPSEFIESVKYFDGKVSPIKKSKMDNGYSKAWLHHKGRNKHHFEYWYDFNSPISVPVIPFKYFCELICDNIAASMTYSGKDYKPENNLRYFNNRKDLKYINEDIKKAIQDVYRQLIDNGLKKTINKGNLKKTYNKYIK